MPNQATYSGALAGVGGMGAAMLAETNNVDPLVKGIVGTGALAGGFLASRGASGAVKVGATTLAGVGGGLMLSAGLDVIGL